MKKRERVLVHDVSNEAMSMKLIPTMLGVNRKKH
jgi:hypothetical protein